METGEDPLRKCNKCKIKKPKSLFYKYQYCKKCHIKNYINYHLSNARVANHLNLSIDELNIIMDPTTRNSINEHERFDEIIMYFTGHNMRDSTIITNNIIENFLNENVIPS